MPIPSPRGVCGLQKSSSGRTKANDCFNWLLVNVGGFRLAFCFVNCFLRWLSNHCHLLRYVTNYASSSSAPTFSQWMPEVGPSKRNIIWPYKTINLQVSATCHWTCFSENAFHIKSHHIVRRCSDPQRCCHGCMSQPRCFSHCHSDRS